MAALDTPRARGGRPLPGNTPAHGRVNTGPLPGATRDLAAARDLRARPPALPARIGGADVPYEPLIDRMQFAVVALILAAVALAIAARLAG